MTHGPGDAHAVDFLERVAPDRVTRHLTGDDHHRCGVHVGGGDAGHRVGRARAGGDEHDAGPAGHPRVAVRHVGRALFVAHQDVLDVLLLVQRVVDVKDRAPGVPEYVPNPVVLEKSDDDLRACQLHLAHLFECIAPARAGNGSGNRRSWRLGARPAFASAAREWRGKVAATGSSVNRRHGHRKPSPFKGKRVRDMIRDAVSATRNARPR